MVLRQNRETKMHVIITINCQDETFEGQHNRILKELFKKLKIKDYPTVIKDLNGNTVGSVEYIDSLDSND